MELLSELATCPKCGHRFASNVAETFPCCGATVSVSVQKQPDAKVSDRRQRLRHLNDALAHCAGCEHRSVKGCGGGCDLYDGKPCDSHKHFMAGGGCLDLENPKFTPCESTPAKWKGWKQPSLDDHCIAVTSLSLLPHHINRQTTCLDSWVDLGLTISSVQQTKELDELKEHYPQVSHWITNDDCGSAYSWKTQRIRDLANVATRLDRTVVLINSDIELYGNQALITKPIDAGKQIVGIRWNYPTGELESATREQWGLDLFSFTPEYAASLPEIELSIGRPIWDYWIPKHSRSVSQEMEFIGDPFLFHESHDIHWSQADWKMGERWVAEMYGEGFPESGVPFRQSLPFPPK